MKYIKTFESLKGEKINMDEVKFIHNESLGYFYSKYINGNRVIVRIDNRGDFGYYVNGSMDIQDNKDIITKLESKITEQDNLINQLKTSTPTNSNNSSIEETSKIDVLEKKVDELQNILISNQNGNGNGNKKYNRKKNNNYQEPNYYLMDPSTYAYTYTNQDMLYRNINGQLYAVGYTYHN